MKTSIKYRVTSIVVAGMAVFGLMGAPMITFAADVDQPCTAHTDCNTGSCRTSGGGGCFCAGLITGSGHCQARSAAGGPCSDSNQCVSGVTCNISTGTCAAPSDQVQLANCWCKKSDGTCENHGLNDGASGHKLALQCRGSGSATTGSSAADTASCEAYCNFRGFRAVHCEPISSTYHDYYTSDSTADETNRCLPRGGGAPTAPGYTPAGLGDGGEDRTSPADFGFVNPLGTSDLAVVISRIIRAALGVVGAVFLAMFVYGGLLWMTSGDSKRIEDARSTLINAVIGMAIVAFSYSMVTIVFNLANQVSGG